MEKVVKTKKKRKEYDLYETPQYAVDELFKLIPIQKGWKYLEPCKASGRIYNMLPIGSAWGEIRFGVDYLKTEYPPQDAVVTNPPFSLAQEFVTKALTEAPVVIMLLRVGFLGSQKRQEWLNKNKPTSLIILSKRPSFTEDGKTDGAEYAWFVWDKENKLKLDPLYFI